MDYFWDTPDGQPDIEKMRRIGRECGYPECCVEAFVKDIAAGRLPGLMRGADATGEYVPCLRCALGSPDRIPRPRRPRRLRAWWAWRRLVSSLPDR